MKFDDVLNWSAGIIWWQDVLSSYIFWPIHCHQRVQPEAISSYLQQLPIFFLWIWSKKLKHGMCKNQIRESNCFVAQRWGVFILNCMETTFQSLPFCLLERSLACSWLPIKAESLPTLTGRLEKKVLLLKILTNFCCCPKCHHWKFLRFN